MFNQFIHNSLLNVATSQVCSYPWSLMNFTKVSIDLSTLFTNVMQVYSSMSLIAALIASTALLPVEIMLI